MTTATCTSAPSGYIWDACARHDLTYRSYGEYGGRVSQPDGSLRMEGRVPGLVGPHVPDLRRSQGPRADGRATPTTSRPFSAEFREFEKNGNLPASSS